MALPSLPSRPELILVYVRKDVSETMNLCKQIREDREYEEVPILLVVDRYQIAHGSAVKTMGNAAFIIAPFDAKGLIEKIEALRPTD